MAAAIITEAPASKATGADGAAYAYGCASLNVLLLVLEQ